MLWYFLFFLLNFYFITISVGFTFFIIYRFFIFYQFLLTISWYDSTHRVDKIQMSLIFMSHSHIHTSIKGKKYAYYFTSKLWPCYFILIKYQSEIITVLISYFPSSSDLSSATGDGLSSKLVKTTVHRRKRYSIVHVYSSRKVLEPDIKCKAFLAYSTHVSIFIIHHLVGS